MDNYTLWTKHGEPGVLMEDNEEDNDDDNMPDWALLYEAGAFEDEPVHEAEENAALKMNQCMRQKKMLQKNNNHLMN